jgi:hypothetical protein
MTVRSFFLGDQFVFLEPSRGKNRRIKVAEQNYGIGAELVFSGHVFVLQASCPIG